MSLTAGQPVPIQVEYFEGTGNAVVKLYSQIGGSGSPVPASWLTPTANPLPQGWNLSADLNGTYVAAQVSENAVTLLDDSGNGRTFQWNGSGFTPPGGEQSVLARDGLGRLTLHGDDGVDYVFDTAGNLLSATTALDDRSPAALVYAWSGSPLRLRTITDPVSSRVITARYGGDAACPTGGRPGSTRQRRRGCSVRSSTGTAPSPSSGTSLGNWAASKTRAVPSPTSGTRAAC